MKEASEKIGITRESLGFLERGKQRPHMPTLSKIARGYGVPVEELLELSEELALPKDEGGQAAQGPQGYVSIAPYFGLEGASGGVPSKEMILVPLNAVVVALEHVRDGEWSVEDAEHWLEQAGVAREPTAEEATSWTSWMERQQRALGKWSKS